MDIARRKTLKRITGVAVATTTGLALSNTAQALTASSNVLSDVKAVKTSALSTIEVYTRVSSVSNDLEVVIRNSGKKTAHITQMTPSQTSTARGVFDFHSLMKEGQLTLAAGEKVSVPMTPHVLSDNCADFAAIHARALSTSLKASFSVITEHDAYAVVDVMDGLRFT